MFHFIQRQQREHTRHTRRLRPSLVERSPQALRHRPTVVTRSVQHHPDDLGPVRLQPVHRGGHEGVIGVRRGKDNEPGAREARVGDGGQGLPDRLVTPTVDRVLLTPLTTPGRERRKQRRQRRLRLLVLHLQRPRQRLQILALHRLPETRVHRIRAQAITGDRHLGSRDGVQPVPLPLEGVRRQLGLPTTLSGEHLPPVDVGAVDMQLGGGGQEPLQAALVAAQRADDHGLGVSGLHRLLHRKREHRMRAHLDEHGVTVTEQEAGRGLQLHRLTQVAVPVLRVQPGRIHQLTRHRRVERHLRRTRRDVRQDLEQLLADRLHMRGVRGVVHRNPANPHLLTLQLGHHLIQRTRITRDHDRARAVDRGDRYRTAPTGDALPRLVDRQPHRHHPATARQATRDGPRPQRHHLRRVLQRQRARHTGRRDLTLTVTHHRIRHHTHRTPQPRQRHHHREQHRLHHIHPIKTGSTRSTTQHIRQRPVHIRRQSRLTLTHRLREHRRGVQQPHRHTHPLRPLTREHEHRTTTHIGHTTRHTRDHLIPGQRTQPTQQLLTISTRHHPTVLEHRTRRRQRERHISSAQLGTPGHELPQPACLRPQRGVALARYDPGHRAIGDLGLGLLRLLGLRRLLQDRVRVRPAHAEGRDAGAARVARLRPRPGLGQQLDVAR